jgi:hypothetical protein
MNEIPEDKQIHKADKDYRKKTLIVLILCTAAGILALMVFQHYLQGIKTLSGTSPEMAMARFFETLKYLLILMAATLFLLAAYLIYMSVRIIRASQFPPPGVKLIRDVKIFTGLKARIIGYICLYIAVGIALTGVIFPYLYYHRMQQSFVIDQMQDVELPGNSPPKKGRM